jgi:hypothetical protein
VARYRLTWGYRLRRAWRGLRGRFTRTQRPQRDLEAEEIARIAALVGRLEIAAMIGSVTAAGQLAGMAEDRIGQARRRMAQDAVKRLRSRAPTDAEGVCNNAHL